MVFSDAPITPMATRCRPAFEKLFEGRRRHLFRRAGAAGTADYSAYLIQAKAYGPQVLINVMGGGTRSRA